MQVYPVCPPQEASGDTVKLPVGVAAVLATVEDLLDTVDVGVDPGAEKEDVVATRWAAGAERYQLAIGSPKHSPMVTPL